MKGSMRFAARVIAVLAMATVTAIAATPVDTTTVDYLTKVNEAPGRPKGSIFAGFENNENVSLYNGNLLIKHPSSPSFSFDGMGFGLTRVYNSNSVRQTKIQMPTPGLGHEQTPVAVMSGRSWIGYGWTMGFGRVFKRNDFYQDTQHGCKGVPYYSYKTQKTFFQDEEGTEHRLDQYVEAHPLLDFSYDGTTSKYTVRTESGTIYELTKLVPEDYIKPNGYDCTMGSGPGELRTEGDGWIHNGDRSGWYTTKITDVRGNIINVEYWGTYCAAHHSECTTNGIMTCTGWPQQCTTLFPEAIKHVWSDAHPEMSITTDVCEQTDTTGSSPRCPGVALGMLKTVHARGFGTTDGSGLDVAYSFYYGTMTVHDDLDGDVTVPVLTSVQLPQSAAGSTGAVSYGYRDGTPGFNGYGPLLNSVSYPTGGVSSYTYGSWICGNKDRTQPTCVEDPYNPCPENTPNPRPCFGIVQRDIKPEGAASANTATWTWHREFSTSMCLYGNYSNPLTNEFKLTRPDGSYSISSFWGHPCGGDFADDWDQVSHGPTGFPQEDNDYDGSGTLVRTTQHLYDCEGPNTSGACTYNEEAGLAMESKTTVFYRDAATGCFNDTTVSGLCTWTNLAGGTGTASLPCQVTEHTGRTSWNQWRMTHISGSFMKSDRYEYVKYEDPADTDSSGRPPQCRLSKHILSKYRSAFAEEGSSSANARVEVNFKNDGDSDIIGTGQCTGDLIQICARTAKQTSSGGTNLVNSACADTSSDLVSTLTYGSPGHLTHVDFTGGDADADGTQHSYGVTIGWEKGQATTVQYDGLADPWYARHIMPDFSGLMREALDPNQLTTTFNFDTLGRLLQITPPHPEENPVFVHYPDLRSAEIVQAPNDRACSASDSDQTCAREVYDGLGRTIEYHRTLAHGRSSIQVLRYDTAGRVIFTSEWMDQAEYETATKVTWSNTDGTYSVQIPVQSDGSTPWGTTTFYGVPLAGDSTNPLKVKADALGRARKTRTADSKYTDTDYCGPHNAVTQYPQSSVTAKTIYYKDGLGRLAFVKAPTASESIGTGASAGYYYDVRGKQTLARLLQPSDVPTNPFNSWKANALPAGQDRTFTYDGVGRLRTSSIPERAGADTIVAYDSLSHPLTTQDALGAARGYFVQNTYDVAGRPLATIRRLGQPSTPVNTDRNPLGSAGMFESWEWTKGRINNNTFSTVPDADTTFYWGQYTYGSCVSAPPTGVSNTALYFGRSCSYAAAPGDHQAVRYAVSGVNRDDLLSFKYWRQVREATTLGSGAGKDRFSVWVTLQTEHESVQNRRVLFTLDDGQASFARWLQAPAVRVGDFFSTTDWGSGTANLYIYIVFEKGDGSPSVTGKGILVDDLTLGRHARETLVERTYDVDTCAGTTLGGACPASDMYSNGYLGQLSKVEWFEQNVLAGRWLGAYRGPAGRLSGEYRKLDWRGLGADSDAAPAWVNNVTYGAFGQPAGWSSPYLADAPSHDEYAYTFDQGMVVRVGQLGGMDFLAVPGVGYDSAGEPTSIYFANGVVQSITRDARHRTASISVVGPSHGGANATYWSTGSYAYDGVGNITAIGGQTFTYDLVSRLTQAVMQHQATSPTDSATDSETFVYDPFGNMTKRTLNVNTVAGHQDVPSETFNDAHGTTRWFGGDSGVANHNQVAVLNQGDNPRFSYDANGNALRFPGKNEGKDGLPHKVGALWDDANRMTAFVEGDPIDGTGSPAEQYRYDTGSYRWFSVDRTGQPTITLRDGTGRTLAEYVMQSKETTPKLDKVFVYAVGQLLAVRTVSTDPMTMTASSVAPAATSQSFGVTSGARAGAAYLVDIRTASGPYATLAGVTLDASNKFSIPNTQFAPGVTNYVRIKVEGGEKAVWSAPVAVAVDGSITPSSENQVRTLSASRSGTNIVLSWGLGTADGKKTRVWYQRTDTGVSYQLTAQALAANVNAFSISTQSLDTTCVRFYLTRLDALLNETGPSVGANVPTAQNGIGPQASSAADPCNESPGDPGPPSGSSGLAFATAYHHRDHLGNLRVVTDASGAVNVVGKNANGTPIEDRHDYYPFGAEMQSSATGLGDRRKFTGHERDTGSGLDYMLARFCGNTIGFLSVDPSSASIDAADPQTWNRYTYVANNPLGNTDPTGASPQANPDQEKNDETEKVREAKRRALAARQNADSSMPNSNANSFFTTVTKAQRLAKLVAAQNRALQTASAQPASKRACNWSVAQIAKEVGAPGENVLWGSDAPKGYLAGDQLDRMKNSTDWDCSLTPQDAQSAADDGQLVIAATPDHIETVRPQGVPDDKPSAASSRGGEYYPLMLHIGLNQPAAVNTINYSWRASRLPTVTFCSPANHRDGD